MEILIVEDEQEIAQLIEQTLTKESFLCRVANDGLTALDIFKQQQPDVVILDLMLPGLDGLEVCTRIRQQPYNKDPYILMLTARGEEIDRVIGLSTGADDYLVKPFSPRELVARVRALLRRRLRDLGDRSGAIRTQSFTIDLEQHCIICHANSDSRRQLDLSAAEFKLMTLLVKHPGRVWQRGQLIEQLWGDNFFGKERVIDTHIARLRKKVEFNPSQPQFIKTVVGVGYKFEDA